MTQPTHSHLGDDILNAWIDGVATDDEFAIVNDHIATCDTCAQRLDELRGVKAMLGDLGDVAPPRSFQLTPNQAKKPTPLTPAASRASGASAIRLLPVVRALSVAAMLAVIVLGGALALRPTADTPQGDSAPTSFGVMATGETAASGNSLEDETAAGTTLDRGEVIDQGEAASAHDSTSDAISSQAQDASATSTTGGLSGLEIATIATGVLAILLGVTWMGLSMSVRNGASR